MAASLLVLGVLAGVVATTWLEASDQGRVGLARTPALTAAVALASPSAALRPTVSLAERHATAARERMAAAKRPRRRATVIAWQPSHQDDTGANGWHEYLICADIVDRAMAELPEFRHVKAWWTRGKLTGTNNYRPKPTNTPAFDREIAMANDAGADVFIAVHNDGAAPSGILVECMPGDAESGGLAARFGKTLATRMGLPYRGLREVRLYSLERPRNEARLRILLEIGDNARDRALLESESGRDRIGKALAEAVRAEGFE